MQPAHPDPVTPQIEDPSLPLAPSHWQPLDRRTSKLTRCLEALRDVSTAFRALQPNSDKRQLKLTITPIHSLAVALRDLFNELQTRDSRKLYPDEAYTALDHHFRIFTTAVPTGDESPLTLARNKLAAHLDKATQTPEYREFWEKFDLAAVADWTMGCTRMLTMLIQLTIYRWRRAGEVSGQITVMCFDSSEVTMKLSDKEGEGGEILGMGFVRSPKEAIEAELLNLIRLVEQLYPNAGKNSPYRSPAPDEPGDRP